MKFTNEQEIVIEEYIGSSRNLLLPATAGAGKTFLVKELLKITNSYEKCAYFVFNNKLQREFEEKNNKQNVTARTMHSIGLRIIKNNLGSDIKFDDTKQFSLIFNYFQAQISEDHSEGWRSFFIHDKITSLIRACCVKLDLKSVKKVLEWHTLPAQDDLTIKTCIYFARTLRKVSKIIDYRNMIEFPALNKSWKLPHYNTIFCDEGQDISELFLLTLERMKAERYVFVGDEKQQIALFSGSDPYIFEKIKERFNTKQLNLTYSFRCPKEGAKLAQRVFSDIRPMSEAIEGQTYLNSDLSRLDPEEDSIVICRNNAPLIEAYYELLEFDVPCTIVGKEIEQGLKRFIQKRVTKNPQLTKMEDFLTLLYEENISLIQSSASDEEKDDFNEKQRCIEILANGIEYIDQALIKIEDMFNEKTNAVRLMTIHKAKGLEANNVFYIETFDGKRLLPSPLAKTPQELYAEKCLEFVCYTRHKENFHFISLDK